MTGDADKWDEIYRSGDSHQRKSPARVLEEYAHLLPAEGTALDLACGTGANALFLAARGLDTNAWDVSREAITRLESETGTAGVKINTSVRDVTVSPPPPASFDVIVVSYYLERPLIPVLIEALNPEGLLFYQTFIRERVDNSGPRNDDYRLARNELLQFCSELTLRVYREEGTIGDTARGLRNEALLIGQKNR